jgi:hypothetical protein
MTLGDSVFASGGPLRWGSGGGGDFYGHHHRTLPRFVATGLHAPKDAFGALSAPKDAFGALAAPKDAFGALSATNASFGALARRAWRPRGRKAASRQALPASRRLAALRAGLARAAGAKRRAGAERRTPGPEGPAWDMAHALKGILGTLTTSRGALGTSTASRKRPSRAGRSPLRGSGLLCGPLGLVHLPPAPKSHWCARGTPGFHAISEHRQFRAMHRPIAPGALS